MQQYLQVKFNVYLHMDAKQIIIFYNYKIMNPR